MPDDRAARLLDEAATAGLRITGLDGWTQTRLAGSLNIRREVVNAIINKDPVAEPSDSRPRMVEACRKIIAFAAIISPKDDAVVPRAVEATHLLDDDAQAYECHKLRLRKVVEDAVGGGAFIESMHRVGELWSHAVNAPPRFRVKMIGNVVLAIQRLLDKPQSRSIPVDLLDHNLRRLTLAEWAARRAVRAMNGPADERAKALDDLAYIRGQAGYAMIFNGLLARSDRSVRRGRRRLWRAADAQPSPDYGHWSNLLRAINDLMANGHEPAQDWAHEALAMAEKQGPARGFAAAFTRLRDNRELVVLCDFWQKQATMRRVDAILARATVTVPQAASATSAASARARRARGPTAAAILLLAGLLMTPSNARAGDGKELAVRASAPVQRVASMPVAARECGGSGGSGATGAGSLAASAPRGTFRQVLRPSGTRTAPPSGTYPPRVTGITRPDLGPMRTPEPARLGGYPLGRRGGYLLAAATRDGYPLRLDDEELDASLTDETPGSADVERLDGDESASSRTADRRATAGSKKSSTNRRFPLIVLRDTESKYSYRTTPKPAPKTQEQ